MVQTEVRLRLESTVQAAEVQARKKEPAGSFLLASDTQIQNPVGKDRLIESQSAQKWIPSIPVSVR
jgi:hypothetical protein